MKNAGIDVLVTQRVDTALGVTLSEQRSSRVRSLTHEVSALGEVPEADETGSATTRTGQAERLLAQSRAKGFDTLLEDTDGTDQQAAAGRGTAKASPAPSSARTAEPSAQVHLSAGMTQAVHDTTPTQARALSQALLDARGAPQVSLEPGFPGTSSFGKVLEGRNPALAAMAQGPEVAAPVRQVLLGVVDALLGSGVFQSSLLADAQSGRMPYRVVGEYLTGSAQEEAVKEGTGHAPSTQNPGQAGPQTAQSSPSPQASPSPTTLTLAPGGNAAALEALHSQAVSVQCLLCPGVPVDLRFFRLDHEDTRQENQEHTPGQDTPAAPATWGCQAYLTLPRLGALRLGFFAMGHQPVRVTMAAREPAAQQVLREALQHAGRRPDSDLARVRLEAWAESPVAQAGNDIGNDKPDAPEI